MAQVTNTWKQALNSSFQGVKLDPESGSEFQSVKYVNSARLKLHKRAVSAVCVRRNSEFVQQQQQAVGFTHICGVGNCPSETEETLDSSKSSSRE